MLPKTFGFARSGCAIVVLKGREGKDGCGLLEVAIASAFCRMGVGDGFGDGEWEMGGLSRAGYPARWNWSGRQGNTVYVVLLIVRDFLVGKRRVT